MHTTRAAAQFAHRLWPAEEQFRQDRELGRAQTKCFSCCMSIFLDPRAGKGHVTNEAFCAKAVDRTQRTILVDHDDRFTIRFLVDSRDKRVQRQGILTGRSHRLFDECSQRATFVREETLHRGSVHSPSEMDAPNQHSTTDELARAMVRILADGRAGTIEDAVDTALRDLRLPPSTRRPTRASLRAHAQAIEESEEGQLGRMLRIEATLQEILLILACLEELVIAEDPEGCDLPPPEVYGRAVRGHFDLDPVVHLRVVTSLSQSSIAQALVDRGFAEPSFDAAVTRYGRMDRVSFETELAMYRILRVPPRMQVDPDRDVVRGDRVEHLGFSALSGRIPRFPAQ